MDATCNSCTPPHREYRADCLGETNRPLPRSRAARARYDTPTPEPSLGWAALSAPLIPSHRKTPQPRINEENYGHGDAIPDNLTASKQWEATGVLWSFSASSQPSGLVRSSALWGRQMMRDGLRAMGYW
jgi:hypothetical protein